MLLACAERSRVYIDAAGIPPIAEVSSIIYLVIGVVVGSSQITPTLPTDSQYLVSGEHVLIRILAHRPTFGPLRMERATSTLPGCPGQARHNIDHYRTSTKWPINMHSLTTCACSCTTSSSRFFLIVTTYASPSLSRYNDNSTVQSLTRGTRTVVVLTRRWCIKYHIFCAHRRSVASHARQQIQAQLLSIGFKPC